MDKENLEINSGYIRLWRKIKNKGWYKNSKFVHLWVHILIKANHSPIEFMWNGKIVVIKAGQFITGRKELSRETGISESSIERILKTFENEHQIEQQKTTKFRLITIIKWEDYQWNGQQNGQQVDNKWTTSGQQVDTNNNDNNDNNDNNIDTNVSSEQSSRWDFQKELEKLKTSKRRDLQIIHLYWLFKGFQFDNKEKFQRALKRDLRAAGNLKGYSDAEIENTMNWLFEKTNIKFTLETVHKFIDENLANLEPIKK